LNGEGAFTELPADTPTPWDDEKPTVPDLPTFEQLALPDNKNGSNDSGNDGSNNGNSDERGT
jgi:hypothetical protein